MKKEPPDPNQISSNQQPLSESIPKSSWQQRLGGFLAAVRPPRLPSVQDAAQSVTRWFSVSEAELAAILASIRAKLPTTEALLVGKPQSGKSSIVRALTGVSADIIGQGFRPHTQYTERYTYPTDDLPLLIFTDTVGLGDGRQETAGLVQDLLTELDGSDDRCHANVLILTVKLTDFATDTLHQIASTIRQRYPAVPCLLVVTCLHELYPSVVTQHPPYPPQDEAIQRAGNALKQNFIGLYDRAVLVDFTLEEDGFEPLFYGVDALCDALAELLPEAEAQTIYQLLDREVGQELGNLYREVGRRYSTAFAVIAAGLAAVPLPFATMPVLTALQVSLVGLLGQLYGRTLTPAQAGGIASAIAGGFVAQAIARELVKFIPGLGSVVAASWAAAYTFALGEAACVYFGELMGGKKPDPQRIQAVMRESFQAAQARFKRQDLDKRAV